MDLVAFGIELAYSRNASNQFEKKSYLSMNLRGYAIKYRFFRKQLKIDLKI